MKNIISQYANDTSLFISGGTYSVTETIDQFNRFYLVSGLKIKLKKLW